MKNEEKYPNRVYKKEIKESIEEGPSTLKDLSEFFDIPQTKLQEILDGKVKFLEMGVYAPGRDNEFTVKLSDSIEEFIEGELALGASKSNIKLAIDNIMRDAKKEKGFK